MAPLRGKEKQNHATPTIQDLGAFFSNFPTSTPSFICESSYPGFGSLCTHNKNKIWRGPKINPYETPQANSREIETWRLAITNCSLWGKCDINHSCTLHLRKLLRFTKGFYRLVNSSTGGLSVFQMLVESFHEHHGSFVFLFPTGISTRNEHQLQEGPCYTDHTLAALQEPTSSTVTAT